MVQSKERSPRLDSSDLTHDLMKSNSNAFSLGELGNTLMEVQTGSKLE